MNPSSQDGRPKTGHITSPPIPNWQQKPDQILQENQYNQNHNLRDGKHHDRRGLHPVFRRPEIRQSQQLTDPFERYELPTNPHSHHPRPFHSPAASSSCSFAPSDLSDTPPSSVPSGGPDLTIFRALNIQQDLSHVHAQIADVRRTLNVLQSVADLYETYASEQAAAYPPRPPSRASDTSSRTARPTSTCSADANPLNESTTPTFLHPFLASAPRCASPPPTLDPQGSDVRRCRRGRPWGKVLRVTTDRYFEQGLCNKHALEADFEIALGVWSRMGSGRGDVGEWVWRCA